MNVGMPVWVCLWVWMYHCVDVPASVPVHCDCACVHMGLMSAWALVYQFAANTLTVLSIIPTLYHQVSLEPHAQ